MYILKNNSTSSKTLITKKVALCSILFHFLPSIPRNNHFHSFLFYFIIWKSIYLFWERESVSREGAERKSEGENIQQADMGLDPATLRSWPELRSRVSRLMDWATQAWLIPFWKLFMIYSSTCQIIFLCCYLLILFFYFLLGSWEFHLYFSP